jgi:hypothetical protein
MDDEEGASIDGVVAGCCLVIFTRDFDAYVSFYVVWYTRKLAWSRMTAP